MTNNAISEYLGLDYRAVKSFFLRKREFIEKYGDFYFGRPTNYVLNERGTQLVSSIYPLRDHYSSLQLDDCRDCELNIEEKCSANSPNQCPILKKGTHLYFQF